VEHPTQPTEKRGLGNNTLGVGGAAKTRAFARGFSLQRGEVAARDSPRARGGGGSASDSALGARGRTATDKMDEVLDPPCESGGKIAASRLPASSCPRPADRPAARCGQYPDGAEFSFLVPANSHRRRVDRTQ